MAKPKRLIPRLLTLLVKNGDLIGWISYILGLAAVLLLPVLGNNNHISENAIMAGSAVPKFGHGDALYAMKVAEDVKQVARAALSDCNALQDWISAQLEELGATTLLHSLASAEDPPFSLTMCKARHDRNPASDHLERTTPASLCGGTNVVAVLKAPKGEGTEVIALVTPLRQVAASDSLTEGDAVALGVGFAVMRVLAAVPWLARDIIWLVADASVDVGPYGSVSKWLEEYHFPSVHAANASHDFMRSGTISHAIVVEADNTYADGAFDLVQLRAEGPNGEMPNLDLVVTAQQLATWREGLSVEIERSGPVAESALVSGVGSVVEWVGQLLGSIDRKWALDTRDAYIYRASALAKFMANQVMGIPTGLHGAFRDFQIDAITLRFMPTTATLSDNSHRARQQLANERSASFYRTGRTVESLVRCLNNLLESFHHASSLYVLVGGDRFVPISTYIIPFFLLLLGLPLKAASLCVYGEPSRSKIGATGPAMPGAALSKTVSATRLPWGHAMAVVGRVYGWALLSALLVPSLVAARARIRMHSSRELGPAHFAYSALLASLAIGLALRKKRPETEPLACEQSAKEEKEVSGKNCGEESSKEKKDVSGKHGGEESAEEKKEVSGDNGGDVACLDNEWMAVKALVLLSGGIGLAAITCINFSLALAYEVVLVPLCLLARPLRLAFGVRSSASVLSFLVPVVVVLWALWMSRESESGSAGFVVLWEWVEVHCWWGSAMFTYTMLGFLPSCVLCAYIFVS